MLVLFKLRYLINWQAIYLIRNVFDKNERAGLVLVDKTLRKSSLESQTFSSTRKEIYSLKIGIHLVIKKATEFFLSHSKIKSFIIINAFSIDFIFTLARFL